MGTEEERFRFDWIGEGTGKVQHNKNARLLRAGRLDHRTNHISEIEAEAEPEVSLIEQARELLRLRNLVESAQI